MSYNVLIPQPISPAGVNYLQQHNCDVTVLDKCTTENICKAAAEADAILARTTSYTNEIFDAAKKLKVIARYGAGVDNIDIESATAHHVQVCNAPTANCNSVAEHTFMLLLACSKYLVLQDRACRRGDFESRNRTQGNEITGKTLGIIGCGHIGCLLAKHAAMGFDMKVIGYDTYVNPQNVPEYIKLLPTAEDVYREADYLSLHVPLTNETRGMINKDVFKIMKKTSFVINCARGGIINEKDLYDAIEEGVIAGAGIDVFEDEPIKTTNPLFRLEKVIVTPHNAAQTHEARNRMGLVAAECIVDVLEGRKPKYPVNKI